MDLDVHADTRRPLTAAYSRNAAIRFVEAARHAGTAAATRASASQRGEAAAEHQPDRRQAEGAAEDEAIELALRDDPSARRMPISRRRSADRTRATAASTDRSSVE